MELCIILLLCQHRTQSTDAGIGLHCEPTIKGWVCQDGSCSQLSLQCCHGSFTCGSPVVGGILPCQHAQWFCDAREVLDEAARVGRESQKSEYSTDIEGSWEVSDGRNKFYVRLQTLWSDYVAEIFHFLKNKSSLRGQSSFADTLYHYLEVVDVFLEGW